jgi:hypothetical protein
MPLSLAEVGGGKAKGENRRVDRRIVAAIGRLVPLEVSPG